MSEIPGGLQAIVVVGVSIIAACGGLMIVHRFIPAPLRAENNDVGGYLFTTVGVIYAVIVAFVVVVVWEKMSDCEKNVEREANAISDIMRDAQVFPDSAKAAIRENAALYVKNVIEDEWPLLDHAQQSDKARANITQLWHAFAAIHCTTDEQKIYLTQSLEHMNILNDERRGRILAAKGGIPGTLWVLLIGGGAVTIAFSFLFGSKHFRLQLIQTAAMAGMIGFVLYLIMAIDRPFSGDLKIESTAFQQILVYAQRFVH